MLDFRSRSMHIMYTSKIFNKSICFLKLNLFLVFIEVHLFLYHQRTNFFYHKVYGNIRFKY